VITVLILVLLSLWCLWRLSKPPAPHEDIWGPWDGDAEAD